LAHFVCQLVPSLVFKFKIKYSKRKTIVQPTELQRLDFPKISIKFYFDFS
jgi:hypothetical protein